MAKYEKTLIGDFNEVLALCENTILGKSISADLEAKSDYHLDGVNVAIRVFERYSWIGKNRVSLNVTLVGKGNQLYLTAITAGGSQAVFFKVNTWGEGSFLESLVSEIEKFVADHQ